MHKPELGAFIILWVKHYSKIITKSYWITFGIFWTFFEPTFIATSTTLPLDKLLGIYHQLKDISIGYSNIKWDQPFWVVGTAEQSQTSLSGSLCLVKA